MRIATQPKSNLLYKSRLFELIFRDKKELLQLYNAMNGTDYDDPELLQINTLENAIYMSMHNDVSFIIDSRLALYEHQSTCSPNLPLRYLFYVSDLYSAETREANLYGTRVIRIPAPRFVIFYNGNYEQPESQTLKLSDMYAIHEEAPALELKALMLNINLGYNQQLMDSCKTLHDYSVFTSKIRIYAKNMELEEAVERAITECISDGILANFLSKNRAEAKSVSIYEYDEEKHMRQEREVSREEGRIEGAENVLELTRLLIEAGRLEDLKRATEDKAYSQVLFKEFGIL
ncbi:MULTISPECIES: hypothetical protein [Clostridia]|uniref:hypothetical protein n=1 Tax=Clostridia TaxID=186801 RepID=UPI00067E6CBC|nr:MULTISPECIES: hypothetical protein [Clostridia]